MIVVYTMASQDLISQFSQDSSGVPAAQPDRSRTPRRPHQDLHQPVPTFRGPMHYAMTTPRPFWHPAGVPPPPPLTSSFSSRPTWTPTASHSTFPPTPPTFLQTPPDHTNLTPQQHNLTPRSPRPMASPLGSSPIREATLVAPLKFHRWNYGNRTSTFTTPTRRMVWIFLAKSVKVGSPATKTSKAWILCKSHSGSSCTKDYTIHGFAVLPTEEKPSFSHLTTLALQYLLRNWSRNYAHGMWTWTSWLLSSHAQPANL